VGITLHDAAGLIARHFSTVIESVSLEHALELLLIAAETGVRADGKAVGFLLDRPDLARLYADSVVEARQKQDR
jgi:hypothetical protein